MVSPAEGTGRLKEYWRGVVRGNCDSGQLLGGRAGCRWMNWGEDRWIIFCTGDARLVRVGRRGVSKRVRCICNSSTGEWSGTYTWMKAIFSPPPIKGDPIQNYLVHVAETERVLVCWERRIPDNWTTGGESGDVKPRRYMATTVSWVDDHGAGSDLVGPRG